MNTFKTSNMKKIIIKILEIILLFLTAVFGLWFNILGGTALIYQNDYLPPEQYNSILFVAIILIAITTVCYLGGTVLVMLKKSILAAVLSSIGSIVLLFLYNSFKSLELQGGFELYMNQHLPSIFITIMTIIIAVAENFGKPNEKKIKREQEKNAQAPSILSDSSKFKKKGDKK